jgi:hypothetical protein
MSGRDLKPLPEPIGNGLRLAFRGPAQPLFFDGAMSSESKTSAERIFNKSLRDRIEERRNVLQSDAARMRCELAV